MTPEPRAGAPLSVLRSAGIECVHRLTNQGAGAFDGMAVGGPHEILVRAQDLESARNVHLADFSKLVVRGAWSSRKLHPETTGLQRLTSDVVFLATARQAQLEYNAGATFYPHYCAVAGMKLSGSETPAFEKAIVKTFISRAHP